MQIFIYLYLINNTHVIFNFITKNSVQIFHLVIVVVIAAAILVIYKNNKHCASFTTQESEIF